MTGIERVQCVVFVDYAEEQSAFLNRERKSCYGSIHTASPAEGMATAAAAAAAVAVSVQVGSSREKLPVERSVCDVSGWRPGRGHQLRCLCREPWL